MEFISAEEFLKQDDKVQEVFVNWWKPQLFDVYAYKKENKPHRVTDTDLEEVKENDFLSCKNTGFPLLTEGQLRKFIEDKTNCKMSCDIGEYGYQITLYKFNEGNRGEEHEVDYYRHFSPMDLNTCNLLQAYWQVAVQIAKESIDNN